LVYSLLNKSRTYTFDITVFQTPLYGSTKGYKEVYRLDVEGNSHEIVIQKVFRMFNVVDCIPNDYKGRFMSTGDILFIDQGRHGQYYYKLTSGGWEKINRIQVK